MSSTHSVDAVVVGAGLGGIYALHKLRSLGLAVVGLERGRGVGGVWRHNGYPGARVDLESVDYCYHFSPEIYREWRWTERFASQPQLLSYLQFVAERLDILPLIRFETPMRSAQWQPDSARWEVRAGDGLLFNTRFLVMATGNLSAPRGIPFPGADRFRGELIRSSRWPEHEVSLARRRVGLIGTGSSGVQIATAVAPIVGHLYVFQRSANYSVPARNAAPAEARYAAATADVAAARAAHFQSQVGTHLVDELPQPAAAYTAAQQHERLERQWRQGGQGMGFVFADQGVNQAANDIVSAFVRDKIRASVKDPAIGERLCPKYPIGTRRLCLDTGYYEIFNRDNVSLVDVAEDPIEEITETGVRTRTGSYALDVIVLALGFRAFVGEIDGANIRNARGETPVQLWQRGPQTLLGLMTCGFPNLFLLTAPGSPSVLSNLFLMNEYHVDWLASCVQYMDAHGYASIEPSAAAQEHWRGQVADAASRLLRLQTDNYMVHVNSDGTRLFMPYVGGLKAYVAAADAVAAGGYREFVLRRHPATGTPPLQNRGDLQ